MGTTPHVDDVRLLMLLNVITLIILPLITTLYNVTVNTVFFKPHCLKNSFIMFDSVIWYMQDGNSKSLGPFCSSLNYCQHNVL